ncbi:MAG TPA: polysaccharide biosynthesis tyrosine autokinase [Opitutaceae bacterium]|nr:polysaccharide biosynthesis tyrosine autokinase [Opitutaceae bacterium]
MPKDSDPKQQPNENGGYGYTYGGNYAGYSSAGYGSYGYGEATGGGVQRTLQDYLLILRERIWYIVVVFLVVFSSSLVYTLSEVKIYQSSARIQILRSDPRVMQVQQVVENDIRSSEDLNTQMKVLESATIVQRVAERLTGPDLHAFLAPYERTSADTAFVGDILIRNRKILPQRATLIVDVAYQHPDPAVAATIANLFVEEYFAHNSRQRIDDSKRAVDDLKGTVEEQQKLVERLAHELQDYKEKNNMVSLDQRKNVVDDGLKASNQEYLRASQVLASAEVRVKQIKEYRDKGADLTELPFIANQPIIAQLQQQLVAQKINITALRERYRDKYPDMIKATTSAAETERELKRAIDAACAQVEADYQTASRNAAQTKQEFERRTQESLELDRVALAYNDKDRELRTQEQILQNIVARRTETAMTSNIATQNARLVDRAVATTKPISPNVALNLGLGVVGGLGLGLAFAFFVAFIDDRVKSSFDIEGVVGLPLIGVIPQIKRMDAVEKAQIVVNNADRQVAEAFLTLHSSLRLKDESKNAKVILTTSTVPGEGKSFTTTNLALTFAAHGEKVIIVDCDLRKPNIHKSFSIENLKGVIDICAGRAKTAEVVVRGVQPNLDVLPAGGRAKNPTQILNSKNFELMLSELRKSYDRVFIDTPPLAAVSDALIVLPLVDGSIFTIYFNKVRRKAAQFAARRLLDANVANFGAVLNGLNLAVSGYYYAQYYDKSYKDYYVVAAKDADSPER